jgi:lon-related putative ATP-dependent protease
VATVDGKRFELGPAEWSFRVDPAAELLGEVEGQPARDHDWGMEVIGQPRALEAMRLGVRIRSKGYNLFVSGAPGTGRRTAALRVLAEEPDGLERLRDIAFVFDFDAPLAPKVLRFPAGSGREFKRELHRLVETLKDLVALQAESDERKKREAEATALLEARENDALSSFEAELAAEGFRAVQVEASPGSQAMDIVPLVRRGLAGELLLGGAATAIPEAPGGAGEGAARVSAEAREAAEASEAGEVEESSFEALQDLVVQGLLPEAAYDALRGRWYGFMDRMKKIFGELRRGRHELEERLARERDEALAPQVKAEIALLARRWEEPCVLDWIKALEADALGHLYLFRSRAEEGPRRRRSPALARYGVNLVVDRAGARRAPVVIENHPSAVNLFGFVEPRPDEEGDSRNAYLRIRAGSFLQASGGWLLLRAEDVVQDEEAWLRLKRVLQDGRVEIQPREGPMGGVSWLKPEPVEADVKVVLLGGEGTYDALYQADPDFQKLFKVHAEFDATMPRSPAGLRDYAAFTRKIQAEERLLPVAPDGLGAVVEQGIRLAEYRNRLSTRFGLLADLLREADYHARAGGADRIGDAAVRQAIATRTRLANLPEEKIEEMIASGEIILQASGKALGRVNGLAVHDRGYFAFGLPAVISAQVSPGEGGVINIEGESGLSGEIYDKAVLIVEGFLRSRYSRDFPLAITASICFEQSYTAVEGDSASSTAVYALLSAIAGIPLRQDVAVTGSLNQIGQVQPVGGVNEKIEGFWRVCAQAGLTGTQGVMIPRRNVVNLTLPREIQEALAAGSFHLWAVSSIDEGIEVLTGMKAGTQDARGLFPPGSFNAAVRRELQSMAKTVKSYL